MGAVEVMQQVQPGRAFHVKTSALRDGRIFHAKNKQGACAMVSAGARWPFRMDRSITAGLCRGHSESAESNVLSFPQRPTAAFIIGARYVPAMTIAIPTFLSYARWTIVSATV
jgi:hypothetical protein